MMNALIDSFKSLPARVLVVIAIVISVGFIVVDSAFANPFTNPVTAARISDDEKPQAATTCPVDSNSAPVRNINRRAAKNCIRNIAKNECKALAYDTLEGGEGWKCKRFYQPGYWGWRVGTCYFGPPFRRNVGECFPYGTLKARRAGADRKHLWLDFRSWRSDFTGGIVIVQRGTTFYISPYVWTLVIHGDVG